MWGIWLIITAVAFSAGEVAHASYTAALAAPLAALAGAGIVTLWRQYRRGGRPAGLILPAAILADAAWTTYLMTRDASFLPWLLPLMLTLAAAGTAALLLAKTGLGLRGRLAPIGLAAGVAAMLVAPTAWTVSTLDSRYSGTVLDAYAGPRTGSPTGIPGLNQPAALTSDQTRILDYATAHRDGARYLFATDSWSTASPYILATGAQVLPMGGFSGEVPFPTLAQFQHLVATGQLRHVLLSGGGFDIFSLLGHAPATPRNTAITSISAWVRQHCTTAPIATDSMGPDPAGAAAMGTGVLYQCAPGS
jgi:4-amino-4-deoxy-L-arabinose transferase-like glycosyltransferase